VKLEAENTSMERRTWNRKHGTENKGEVIMEQQSIEQQSMKQQLM
jgi:hypothetical protein